MTMTEFRAAIEAAAWAIYESPSLAASSGVPWYACLGQADLPDCQNNEKPPSLVAFPSAFEVNGTVRESVEYDLAGEVAGQWIKLTAYAIPLDQALAALPRAKRMLRAAWMAAVEAGA